MDISGVVIKLAEFGITFVGVDLCLLFADMFIGFEKMVIYGLAWVITHVIVLSKQ